jgi:MtrB/PioB family decaheme-associated outer membrane protein
MRSRAFATALFCVAGAVALIAPRTGMAQAKPDSARADTTGRVTAAADFGARVFSQPITPQQRAKFYDYRDMPSGFLLQRLNLAYVPADNFRSYQLTASNVGQLDQTLGLRAKEPGLFDVQLRWDRIPHTFSTDGRSLYSETSPGVYTLPSPRPDTGTFNRAPFIGPIRTVWDPVKLGVAYTPSQAWDFKAEYTHTGKNGERPMGMAFGGSSNNASEILEPIDQTVHSMKLSESYAEHRFQLVGTYDLSVFQNSIKSVTAANPLVLTDTPTGGSANGRTALAPDNLAHTGALTGGINLPMSTRVTGNATVSWWRQNDPFIPVTINSAIVSSAIAQLPTSLDGSTRTTNLNGTISTRPLSALSFSGRFRMYSFRDAAEAAIIPVIILNDRSVAAADTAQRDPFTRRNSDLSGSWQVLEPVSLSAGYAWEQMERDSAVRNVLRTNENTPRASLDFTGLDWANLRATYSKGWRRGDGYRQYFSSEMPLSRRFDESDRNRERTSLMASVTPIDQITISGTWQVGHDFYPTSAYGVQSDKDAGAGGDIDFTLTTWLTAGVGLMHETFDNVMRARYRSGADSNATYDWVGNNTDASTTTSANILATLIPDRLQVGGTYQMAHSQYAMLTSNPLTPTGGTAAHNLAATAVNLPEVTQTLQPINVYARYQFTRDWAFTVRYQGELYYQNDYKTLGLNPATATSATNMYLFLANNFQNYDARFFTFTFSYRPQAMKLGRSTL